MPVTVVIDSVLLETETPDIVLASDAVGTRYLCCLVERNEVGDRFVGVPISAVRLAQFRSGRIDLRTILTEPERGDAYEGAFSSEADRRPRIQFESVPRIADHWLPDAGFLLTAVLGEFEDVDVIREAVTRQAAFLVCRFDPPEARGRHKIDADHLAEGVKAFQMLVKYALKKTFAGLSTAARQALGTDAHVIQATVFAPGSFEVHFESKHGANLIGLSSVGQAMPKVDALLGLTGMRADEQLPILRENRGHAVSALQRLLRFIAKEGATFEYRWADPAMQRTSGREVTPVAADALCAVLDHRTELTVEEVRFTGRFVRVAEDKKTWQATEEGSGTIRRGRVHSDAATILQGVRITEERYDFVCHERVEETTSGRQVPKLILVDLHARA